MLYLDQPVQVGMSYDSLTNVTTNIDTGDVEVADFSNGVPAQNASFYVGTYASQDANLTTRGTENSARALWHFAQVWFQDNNVSALQALCFVKVERAKGNCT